MGFDNFADSCLGVLVLCLSFRFALLFGLNHLDDVWAYCWLLGKFGGLAGDCVFVDGCRQFLVIWSFG